MEHNYVIANFVSFPEDRNSVCGLMCSLFTINILVTHLSILILLC